MYNNVFLCILYFLLLCIAFYSKQLALNKLIKIHWTFIKISFEFHTRVESVMWLNHVFKILFIKLGYQGIHIYIHKKLPHIYFSEWPCSLMLLMLEIVIPGWNMYLMVHILLRCKKCTEVRISYERLKSCATVCDHLWPPRPRRTSVRVFVS